MKRDVKEILREKGKGQIFNDTLYEFVKGNLKNAGTAIHLFRIDPYYKAQWIADMMLKIVEVERKPVDEVKKLFVPCGICHCPDSCIPQKECYNDWQDNK